MIPDGARVFMAGVAGEPLAITAALSAAVNRLKNVEITMLAVPGINRCEFLKQAPSGSIRVHSFMSTPDLAAAGRGMADYIPAPLSRIPVLISQADPFDVGLFQVSPPDANGFCTWGTAVDVNPEALANCRLRIAQVNRLLPPARGKWAQVPYEAFDYVVWADSPVITYRLPEVGKVERAIAANVAALIPDGATIQVGFGSLARAVLEALGEKRDLGIHSGMLTDTMVDLAEAGVLTGARKQLDAGLAVATSALGTGKLFQFIATGDASLRPVSYTHDPSVLARQRGFFAINSALQVDLTGQVNAEWLKGVHISGYGGQPDFMAAAARCPDGLSIIALPAVNRRTNTSNILAQLPPGAPVTTIRGDVDAVVTEFGIAILRGRSLSQRAEALLSVAHPDFRGEICTGRRY